MSVPLDTQTLLLSNKDEILQLFQERKIDFNAANNIGQTVLHMIFYNKVLVEKDVIELLEIILNQGIDPNTEDHGGITAIHMAVERQMKNAVELLIRRNATIDKYDVRGRSIAHYFLEKIDKEFSYIAKSKEFAKIECSKFHNSFEELNSKMQKYERENADFVEWLISKGFNFHSKNKEGKSALKLSMEHYLQHILLVLLKHSASAELTDLHDKTTLLHSFLYTNAKGRGWWYENNSERSWYSRYASRYATDIVKLLLDKGFSSLTFDSYNRTPLWIAISEEEEQSIIEMMVDRVWQKTDLTTTLFLELSKSCRWWADSKQEYYLNLLQALGSRGADVNVKDKTGQTPLYFAIQAKNLGAVDYLSKHVADFKTITDNGENLFHALAGNMRHGKPRIPEILEAMFQLLLSKGCRVVNATNKFGDTPLHFASQSGNFVIARKLIECGAQVNHKNKYGDTPLHLNVQRAAEASSLVLLLLRNGAAVNEKDRDGRRPLHYAARGVLVPTILLSWGAYVNVYVGKESPFSTAIKNVTVDRNATMMLSYGADINDEHIVNLVARSNLTDRTIRAVLRHWIKLKVAELPCSQEYEAFVDEDEELQELREDCLREVEILKATFIDDRTSIYAWMQMDFDSRRSYIGNEKLEKLVNTKLELQFPKYHVVILASYRETVVWRKLLRPAKYAWLVLTGIALPDICIERIFGYVRIVDLVNISEYDEENDLRV